MRIVEIREVSVPLQGNVANAAVSFEGHTVSLVAVVSDVVRNGRPLVGVAFNSIGRFAQGSIIRERLAPRLLKAEPDSLLSPAGALDPAAALAAMLTGEKPGGHGDRAGAIAAVELAFWDLLAKCEDRPAYQTIADAVGRTPVAGGVEVYAAGGYYEPGKGVADLAAEIAGYRDAGYTGAKIKIAGATLAEDIERVQAAIQAMGDSSQVAVDANGRFDFARALEYGRELAPLNLRWYEEPGDPLDIDLHRRLAQEYSGALATGENLFSTQDVRNLLTFGSPRADLDVFQMDAGLSYGLTEYLRMIALLEEHGIDRSAAHPHGGHLINLHIVTALGLGGCEAYPGVFQPFGGYSPECELTDGRIRPGDSPGFGLEAKPELAEAISRLVA